VLLFGPLYHLTERADRLRALAEAGRVARPGGPIFVATISRFASLLDGLLPIWFTPEFIAADPPAVRYVRTCFESDSGEGYGLACEALAAADLRPLAPSIAAPTLIVCGDQELPPFRDAARWLEANIRGARLTWLSPARHASVLQQPEGFVRAASEFLGA